MFDLFGVVGLAVIIYLLIKDMGPETIYIRSSNNSPKGDLYKNTEDKRS